MKKVIKVNGMMCQGCVNRINNIIDEIDGVNDYDVSLEDKMVMLDVDDSMVLEEVIERITDIGFDVYQESNVVLK